MSELEIAIKAVEIYASRRPVPVQVNQSQAAQMLEIDPKTLRKMISAGTLKLNGCGLITTADIYKLLSA